jgi:hypothetical protein
MFKKYIGRLFRKSDDTLSRAEEYVPFKEPEKNEMEFGFVVAVSGIFPFLKMENVPPESLVQMLTMILKDLHKTALGQFYIEYLEKNSSEFGEYEEPILEALEIISYLDDTPIVDPTEVFPRIFEEE